MIGNTILFRHYDHNFEKSEKTGLVVDAFTEITGNVSGVSVFGFGETEGKTASKRIYKVEFKNYDWSKIVEYVNIRESQLISILVNVHKINEEKFQSKL